MAPERKTIAEAPWPDIPCNDNDLLQTFWCSQFSFRRLRLWPAEAISHALLLVEPQRFNFTAVAQVCRQVRDTRQKGSVAAVSTTLVKKTVCDRQLRNMWSVHESHASFTQVR